MKLIASMEAYVAEGDYRKYVGPRWAYDLKGAWQFMVLCFLGLREHHHLLEIAAGSLRAGRLFIPYLRPDHYFAVEAQESILRNGIDSEIGEDLVRIKRPRFAFNDTFDFSSFDRKFDYVMAHSILCHLAKPDAERLIHNAAAVVEPKGHFVGNYSIGEDYEEPNADYAVVTRYKESTMREMVEKAGLVFVPLPFNDRRADERWFLGLHPHVHEIAADSALGYMMQYWKGANEQMGHTDDR